MQQLPCGCTSRQHTAGFVQGPKRRREGAAAWRQHLCRQHRQKRKGSGAQKTRKVSEEIR